LIENLAVEIISQMVDNLPGYLGDGVIAKEEFQKNSRCFPEELFDSLL